MLMTIKVGALAALVPYGGSCRQLMKICVLAASSREMVALKYNVIILRWYEMTAKGNSALSDNAGEMMALRGQYRALCTKKR